MGASSIANKSFCTISSCRKLLRLQSYLGTINKASKERISKAVSVMILLSLINPTIPAHIMSLMVSHLDNQRLLTSDQENCPDQDDDNIAAIPNVNCVEY